MLQTRNAKRPAQAAVRFAVDAVEEELLDRAEAIATIDAGQAGRAAAPGLRARRGVRGAGRGRAGLAGRGQGRDRVHGPRGRRRRRGRARRDPRAALHRGRRRGGLPRRQGHPDRGGGQGLARGAGGPGDGQAVRCRRVGARDRPQRQDRQGQRHDAERGRPDRHRRHGRDRHGRRRRARGARGVGALPDRAGLGGRAAHARRARQRRHARGRRQGARVRRRGDRPVPHRAHVHGGGPPAQDARDDHGRVRGGAPRARSTSCCRSSSRTSRACSSR